MTVEEIRRRFEQHRERLAREDDFNRRMDMRQEFRTQCRESLDRRLAQLAAQVAATSEKVDSLSDLRREISRLVLQHNQRIDRLER